MPHNSRMTDRGPAPGDTLAVVLAAGAGTRFAGQGHKLDARLDARLDDHHDDDRDGRPIAQMAIDAAVASGIGDVVVVTGATTTTSDGRDDVASVYNPDWRDGQSTSLAVAITEAARRGVDAIVVGLADQPFVTAEGWRRVAASSSPIAVATYDGERRNPVRLHASVWQLVPNNGDEGARSLIRCRPDLVGEVPCPGSPADIDTLEDLRTWQNRSSTNSP